MMAFAFCIIGYGITNHDDRGTCAEGEPGSGRTVR